MLAALVPIAAQAAPTGLNQIPTTDLVPVGQLTLQLQNGNTEVSGSASVFHQPQPVPQSEFGVPWNIETGLDVAPSDPPHDYRPLLNVKWSPVHEDYRIPAAAVGALQLGVGFTPNYYLRAEQDAQLRRHPVPEIPRPSPQPEAARHPAAHRHPRASATPGTRWSARTSR